MKDAPRYGSWRLIGGETAWPLPPTAIGSGEVYLIRTPDGLLFLFNQPGRVLRLRPTPDAAEPFILEATFTRNIPNTDHPARIWLDPAGRIIIASEGNHLSILFPAGHIPTAIREMMPADHGSDDENEP